MLNKPGESAWATAVLEKLDADINRHCWDGNWYLCVFRDNGLKVGSHESDESSIFLNTQS